MEIENADRTLLYARHPGSFEEIQFKLSQSYLESPMRRHHQNSLTYTASMETVHDHLRFHDDYEPCSAGLPSLAHRDIFIQGIKLNCPEPAISLRLITDEGEEVQNLLVEMENSSIGNLQLSAEIHEEEEEEQEEVIFNLAAPKVPEMLKTPQQLFKKKSVLKISNIQYQGKLSPSEKQITTSNTIHSNPIKRTIPSKKINLSKIVNKRKYSSKIEKENSNKKQISSKESATLVPKSASFKLMNLLGSSGSDFIDEEENLENKAPILKKHRIFSMIDPESSQQGSLKRPGSVIPCKRKIQNRVRYQTLKKQASEMSNKNKVDHNKLTPQASKPKKEGNKLTSFFQIVATKVSLTDRKSCLSSHAIGNRKSKAYSDIYESKNRTELRNCNKKQEPENPVQISNLLKRSNFVNKARENVYRRKVKYMR